MYRNAQRLKTLAETVDGSSLEDVEPPQSSRHPSPGSRAVDRYSRYQEVTKLVQPLQYPIADWARRLRERIE